MEVDLNPAEGGNRVVIANNQIVAYYDPVDVYLMDGGGPAARLDVIIFNNSVNHVYDDAIYIQNSGSLDGAEVNYFIANNDALGGFESEAIDAYFPPGALALVSHNSAGHNDVDSSPAIVLHGDALNPGLIVIQNNIGAFAAGDGLEVSWLHANVINNTFALNGQYGSEEGGMSCWSNAGYCQWNTLNNIVVGNSGFELGAALQSAASYSWIGYAEQAPGIGNLTGDPVFVSAGDIYDFNNYFALAPASRAIDAGDPALRYNDPDGSRNDMGAFGGPAAGRIGYLGPDVALPLVAIGVRPLVELASGGRLLDPSAVPAIVFTNDVNPATIDAVTFATEAGPVAGALAAVGNRITFTPEAPFDEGELVTVSVATSLRDERGQALAYPFEITFGIRVTSITETESNDDAESAETLLGPVFGITGNLDVDYYAIDLEAGERLTASVFCVRDGGTDLPLLRLLASDGTTELNLAHPDGGQLYDAYLSYRAETSGTYYVAVEIFAGTANDAYELEGVIR